MMYQCHLASYNVDALKVSIRVHIEYPYPCKSPTTEVLFEHGPNFVIKSNVSSNPDSLNGSALLLYLSRLIGILGLRTNFQAKLRKLINTVNQPLSTPIN
jgi:hypothetical protein